MKIVLSVMTLIWGAVSQECTNNGQYGIFQPEEASTQYTFEFQIVKQLQQLDMVLDFQSAQEKTWKETISWQPNILDPDWYGSISSDLARNQLVLSIIQIQQEDQSYKQQVFLSIPNQRLLKIDPFALEATNKKIALRIQISDQMQLQIFENDKQIHSSSEWDQEEQETLAAFSRQFVPLYRVYLENDQDDAQFEGGVVRLWSSNIKEIAKTSGVTILKQIDNSDDVQEISVDAEPKQEEPPAEENNLEVPNDEPENNAVPNIIEDEQPVINDQQPNNQEEESNENLRRLRQLQTKSGGFIDVILASNMVTDDAEPFLSNQKAYPLQATFSSQLMQVSFVASQSARLHAYLRQPTFPFTALTNVLDLDVPAGTKVHGDLSVIRKGHDYMRSELVIELASKTKVEGFALTSVRLESLGGVGNFPHENCLLPTSSQHITIIPDFLALDFGNNLYLEEFENLFMKAFMILFVTVSSLGTIGIVLSYRNKRNLFNIMVLKESNHRLDGLLSLLSKSIQRLMAPEKQNTEEKLRDKYNHADSIQDTSNNRDISFGPQIPMSPVPFLPPKPPASALLRKNIEMKTMKQKMNKTLIDELQQIEEEKDNRYILRGRDKAVRQSHMSVASRRSNKSNYTHRTKKSIFNGQPSSDSGGSDIASEEHIQNEVDDIIDSVMKLDLGDAKSNHDLKVEMARYKEDNQYLTAQASHRSKVSRRSAKSAVSRKTGKSAFNKSFKNTIPDDPDDNTSNLGRSVRRVIEGMGDRTRSFVRKQSAQRSLPRDISAELRNIGGSTLTNKNANGGYITINDQNDQINLVNVKNQADLKKSTSKKQLNLDEVNDFINN